MTQTLIDNTTCIWYYMLYYTIIGLIVQHLLYLTKSGKKSCGGFLIINIWLTLSYLSHKNIE